MKIDYRSERGNAYVIMGLVCEWMRDHKKESKWPDVLDDMTSGDYRHLCEVAKKATNGAIEVTGFNERTKVNGR